MLAAAAAAAWQALRLARQVNLTGFVGPGNQAAIQLPAGFQADVFASGLDGPRFIAFGPDGVLHVAERGAGRIVRLPDEDGDGQADRHDVFAADLASPHSLAFHQGRWFVGVPSGVVTLTDEDGDGTADIRQAVIDDYPTGGHNTRTVLFLDDGRMLVSVGSSCNACLEQDPRRAAILVYDGGEASGERLYASGLRNAVGLTLQPGSGQLWASNNGRDFLGDDQPPDSLHSVQEGADYGWPACHAGRIVDPELGNPDSCQGVPTPAVEIQAHSAPLGLVFYNSQAFPAEYQGDLFVALHGSWNRSQPVGYKVVRVPFESGQPAGGPIDFASGWLAADGSVSGRPVGLAVGPDGALYLSDDLGGFIYRITFTSTGS